MELVIVESPTKEKSIQGYLGKDYIVVSSYGHVCDLPSKKGSVDVENDFEARYEISPKSVKNVEKIVQYAKKASNILLATDPDREGEAIAWHVADILHQKNVLRKGQNIKRIAFNEITKKAVKESLNNKRDIDMDLVYSQQARRILDYLVGFALSEILWIKLPGSKSAGRVQSVALILVCERELERQSFNIEEYWTIEADFCTQEKLVIKAKLTHLDNEKLDKMHIKNKQFASDIVKLLAGKNYVIDNVEYKSKKRNPYPPFTTSSMQQDASNKLNMGAKTTMIVAQQLYEGIKLGDETVGLITYMRTDGVSVSKETIDETRNYIAGEFGGEYLPENQRQYKTKAKNAQEAHEAIRPTDIRRTPKSIEQYLNKQQYKLYNLIWQRMVASQMESAVFDQQIITIKSNDDKAIFTANGSVLRFDGFLKIYNDDSDDQDQLLPKVKEKEKMDIDQLLPNQHFTQPPPRFTESSLIKKLEELGIGRPSTYATIISIIQDRKYVILDKKQFIPEERGILVSVFLKSYFAKYVEYGFTANLEEELDLISSGQKYWKTLLREFWDSFSVNVSDVREYKIPDILVKLDEELVEYLYEKNDDGTINKKCPKCADGILSLKISKYGAFIGCSGYPECNYTHKTKEQEMLNGEHDKQEEATDKLLGSYSITGEDIFLKKGPYGYYIQLDGVENKSEKPKRVGIPKNISIDNFTINEAEFLISLPKNLGLYDKKNQNIIFNIGRYGPYLTCGDKNFKIPAGIDYFTMNLEIATDIIDKVDSVGVESKNLGQYKEMDIKITDGKFGPYIKYGKNNISIPKDMDALLLNYEDAVNLIEGKLSQSKEKPKSKKKKV